MESNKRFSIARDRAQHRDHILPLLYPVPAIRQGKNLPDGDSLSYLLTIGRKMAHLVIAQP